MNKNLPLSNIVVLDLTNVLSGPFATQILSDLGAEIIKVEKPDGDDSRKFGPFIKKRSSYFISLNRGKKSIILDFKNEEDKKIYEEMKQADKNMRKSAKKLGIKNPILEIPLEVD